MEATNNSSSLFQPALEERLSEGAAELSLTDANESVVRERKSALQS